MRMANLVITVLANALALNSAGPSGIKVLTKKGTHVFLGFLPVFYGLSSKMAIEMVRNFVALLVLILWLYIIQEMIKKLSYVPLSTGHQYNVL